MTSLFDAPEVDVHRLDAGGRGVGALPNGKVVFIPRTAPGDRVVVRVVKEKPRWAQGEALKWLRKGPNRRNPPCSLYSSCGGCSLQHLEYSQQLFWKSRFVGEALRRLGGMETTDPQVVPSPLELRYRNKMTFTLRRLPSRKVVAGLRELAQPGRVLDIGSECLLPEEELAGIWGELRKKWGSGAALLPGGRELRLTLRSGATGAGLLIQGGHGDGDPEALLRGVAGLTSIWRGGKGETPRHLAGLEEVVVDWGDAQVSVPGSGFVQVNRGAGEEMYGYVIEEAGDVGGRTVIDGFCGPGVLGRSLAAAGALVVGIDIVPFGAVDTSFPCGGTFRAVMGRVEEMLERLLPADLVVLNPPRAGLDPSVPKTLGGLPPERIVYVSCDPATLGRDLQRLSGSFAPARIRCFDLFPQTGHVETVVSLRRVNG